ncbi:monocyte differentiation antigen cd14 [Limosa lapponica baueri]|uniref:Monocyte differentiation antigen cd14 n=1 Tax=Limosa lapponica baueri TaxID=1758121 RepID=A0A2I0U0S7_LIMLA|nr:monocyte differentiation antigen cd14 [Limosa lapponica baueri]
MDAVEESCLTVDGIFRLDAEQEKILELARPQLALVPLGYSVSLLLWGPHGPGTQLPFQSIVWQVIDIVFRELEAAGGDAQSLQTVSLVQVSAHEEAWDLLRPDGRALQVMDMEPLGLVVEEAMEIAVPDAQAAIGVYARGLGALPAPADGCWATRGAPATGHPLPDTRCLPWVVERLLEGNSLTFLLLCVTLPGVAAGPDTSRAEILAALGLAQRVKTLAKTISATLWDPAQEVTARRTEIRELRMELLAGAGLPEQKTAVARLRRALRELQWDTARWQQEVAMLGLRLEAAQRKQEAAEWDLEASLQSHQQERQACRQRLLQVLGDQQRLAEEQREALDRQYRELLQEVLRDAVELAARNQQLREARGLGSADATTQTP